METFAQIKDLDWSLVASEGNVSNWPIRLWPMEKYHHWLGRSGGYGVGYGAPASIGAALVVAAGEIDRQRAYQHQKHALGRALSSLGEQGQLRVARIELNRLIDEVSVAFPPETSFVAV